MRDLRLIFAVFSCILATIGVCACAQTVDTQTVNPLIVIDGRLYKLDVIPHEQITNERDKLIQIIRPVAPDLEQYGIKDIKFIENLVTNTGIYPYRNIPIIIVVTEHGSYCNLHTLEGEFGCKQGGKTYSLNVRTDSTYTLERVNKDLRSITSSGRCFVKHGELILLPQGNREEAFPRRVTVNAQELTIPACIVGNKKSLKLRRIFRW